MSAEPERNCACPECVEIGLVIDELLGIRRDMIAAAVSSQARLDEVHPQYRDSARNLLHYLAMRRRDLRTLQSRLAALGLSSLGRAESHVLATVDTVLKAANGLLHRPGSLPPPEDRTVTFADGQRLLAEHTEKLLGPTTPGRNVRIMVTMPSEAADSYTLVHDLLQQGMNCMRINCAHDDESARARMIEHLRRAERALGRTCRIVMDLAGPKLRTGPVVSGPVVYRVRPRRDAYGRVTAPARVWLTADRRPENPPSPADACLPMPEAWLGCLRAGERLELLDARGARRTLTVVDVTGPGCWAEATKTAYITPGTVLRRVRADFGEAETPVGELPPGTMPCSCARATPWS
ncbi:MAG: pyruvate kinase [Planctomycetota bacterium]